VIASALLPFSSRLALRAVGEIGTVLCVLSELFVLRICCYIVVTRPAQVPGQSALEAHRKAANTDSSLLALAILFYVIEASGLGAPAKLGIQVDNDVLMIAQVLGVDVLRAKLLDVLS